jgi:Mg/Co/Ni transporter MgtE
VKLDALVVAHARAHPAEVAALLGQQNVEEAVAFCLALPDTAAAPLVAALSGTLAQRVLITTEPQRVAGWLATASFDEAAGLLSRVQPAQRSKLIEAIRSGRRRQELSRRFAYADGTLGAIASRDVITVPVGATLRDVALELHEQGIAQGAEPPIYLLGAGGQLHGSLDLYRALETEDLSLTVERCMVTVEALPADMPLDAALASRRWGDDLVLPVVDRNRNLLGAVTLQRIREASRSDGLRGQDLDAVADLARRFINVLVGLAEVAIGGRTRR